MSDFQGLFAGERKAVAAVALARSGVPREDYRKTQSDCAEAAGNFAPACGVRQSSGAFQGAAAWRKNQISRAHSTGESKAVPRMRLPNSIIFI